MTETKWNLTPENLNTFMEFDHVIKVNEDSTVEYAPMVQYPTLTDDELDSDRWTLLNGYSGQFRYSGPVMHNSEYIGGRLAEDILEQPGYYVAIPAYWTEVPDGDILPDIEGWAIAYREGPTNGHFGL
jgi:hypothetical protein